MLFNKERALKLMKEKGFDAIVATSIENVSYLSGFYAIPFRGIKKTQYYVVFSQHNIEKKPIIIPSMRLPGYIEGGFDISQAYVYGKFPVAMTKIKTFSPLTELIRKGMELDSQFKTPFEALVTALKDLNLSSGTIALDEMHYTHQQWEKLEREFPNAKFIPGYDFIRKIRMVKTDEEIKRLKKSTHIIQRAILESFKIIQLGTTERELVYKMQEIIGKYGALPGIVGLTAGPRSALLLNESDYQIKMNDQIRYDVGCISDLYWSDMGRTVCLGKIGDKQKKAYHALKIGRQAAIESVKPGIKASDIYNIAISEIRKAGLPHYERPHCGHGIGLEFYDPPNIRPDDHTVMEEGMVFNIETPYYAVGLGGFQLEDTMLVKKDGIELFSDLPMDIIII